MECAECGRLSRERHMRQLIYDKTLSQIRGADIRHGDAVLFMVLRKELREAKTRLEVVDGEVVRHQQAHAVPTRAARAAQSA
jgi:hypothetical protein